MDSASETGVQHVEAIVLNDTDMGPTPERLGRECGSANFMAQYYWLMLFDTDDKPPLFYVRTFGPQQYAESRSIIQFNEQIDRPQLVHPLHSRLSARAETDMVPTVLQGDPEGETSDATTFEYRISDPSYLYRSSSRSMHVKEGELLDLKLNYFPYAVKMTDQSPLQLPYVLAFGEVTGVLDGRKVRGLGGNEILYHSPGAFLDYRQMFFIDYCAVREDGRRECTYVMMFGHERSLGFYWLEGEDPIVSQDVTYHGDWQPLPYTTDGTLMARSLDFRFAGKSLHYRAKWGFRGWSDPYNEAPGFFDSAGVIWEGDTPYKHQMCFATAEGHLVLADTVRPNDF